MSSMMLVSGEISGDMHAGGVLRALRARGFKNHVWGCGGDELSRAGMDVRHHTRDLAVMGLWEVLKKIRYFKSVYRDLLREADRTRPSLAVLVDYPGLNLRLARELKKRGIRVIYFICPQVWAWHRSRIPAMARCIDRLLVIFPFEIGVFSGTGLQVDYVGHPLAAATRAALLEPEKPLPWPDASLRIALFPGSRRQELERVLPSLWGAAVELEKQRPDAGFLLASASEEMDRLARSIIAQAPQSPRKWNTVIGQMRETARQARAAWVTSGTATLETALMGCPLVVVYRAAALTYQLGRRLIRVPHIGMVNLVAGRGICPELIQHDCEPVNLARTLDPLLDDSDARRQMISSYAEIRKTLGDENAAERAASIILQEWESHAK